MLRLLHLSDTHLGYSEFDKVSPSGINQREEDCYRVFHEAISKALELKVDAVIHSGDFFHRPWPSNRALIEAFTGLKRLVQAKIPVVIISGNHSTPRTIYTSPILKTLASLDQVYPVYQERYEQITIADTVFHAIPYVNNEDAFKTEIARAIPLAGKANVLILHSSIGKDYMMEEFGERIFPPEYLSKLDEFDYTALGHFHNYQKVKGLKSSWYAGSTERLCDKEAGTPKGLLLVELPEGLNPSIGFIPLAARPWHLITVDNCFQKTVAEIRQALEERTQALDTRDALLTIRLLDLKPLQGIELSHASLCQIFPQAMVIQVRRSFVKDEYSLAQTDFKQESLFELFCDYIRSSSCNPQEAQALIQQASSLFNALEQQRLS